MAQKSYTVQLPEELLHNLGWPEEEVPARVRELLVMELLRRDRMTEAEAARLLGLDRWQLLELMGRMEVPAVRLTSREMKREIASVHIKSQ